MSAIFGVLNLDGAPVDPSDLNGMRDAIAPWGPDGVHTWCKGSAALGQCLLLNTPEAVYEKLPDATADGRLAFTAEGRIDNRADLFEALDVPHTARATMPDGSLMLLAYEKWGEASPGHLIGDWSFAACHLPERRLFLARDHHGHTSLYYVSNARRFAFASDRWALLSLPGVPRRLNELYLAQLMTAWPAYQGSGTAYEDVHRLPPAHSMRVTPSGASAKSYWSLNDTPDAGLRSQDSCVELLDHVFTAAVQSRLRSHRPVGSMLSGGLDSGMVVVAAARELARAGKELTAFTAAPAFPTSGLRRDLIGDEWPQACETAQQLSNVTHVRIGAEEISPVSGLRRMIAIHGEPLYAAENMFWLVSLFEAARARGIGTLFTGRGGNATISWRGPSRRPLRGRLVDRLPWLADIVRPAARYWRRRVGGQPDLEFVEPPSRAAPWRTYSAIHPEFARRVDLLGRMQSAGHDPTFLVRPSDPRRARMDFVATGRSIAGALAAENGAAFGYEIRDPTIDIRVIQAAFSIPVHLWAGPSDRWLARQLTRQMLPDAVRLNRSQGRQAGDLIWRLRLHRDEGRELLTRIEGNSLSGRYVDLDYLERLFGALTGPNWRRQELLVGCAFIRGLGAAEFLASL